MKDFKCGCWQEGEGELCKVHDNAFAFKNALLDLVTVIAERSNIETLNDSRLTTAMSNAIKLLKSAS